MDKWGVPVAIAGVGATENKGIALGVSATMQLSLGFRGHHFGGGFGTFGMIPKSYGIPSLSP